MKRINLKNGNVIAIEGDEFPTNPLEFEETYNYYTWRSHYHSIMENDFESADEWVDSIVGDGSYDRQREKSQNNNRDIVGFAYDLCSLLDKKGIWALPILTFEHTTISYYIGDSIDRWDGSVVGFVWAEKEALYKEYGVKRLTPSIKEKAKSVVSNALELYTDYANGEVYVAFLFDSQEDCDNEDVRDSVGGLYYTNEDEFKEEVTSLFGFTKEDIESVTYA